MATAPDAIWHLWYAIEAKYNGPGQQDEEMAGIVGDRAHSFGFHLSPNDLHALGVAASDYSLQTARDRAGAKAHPDDASALDVHFGPKGMVTVTTRLIASANDPDDHRLDCLYEFCGTTNGVSPHPYTVDGNTDDPRNTQGWDDSHVTHVHLSVHRDVCTDYAAIAAVADVIAGIPLKPASKPAPIPDEELPVDQATFNKLMNGWAATDDGKAAIRAAVWGKTHATPTTTPPTVKTMEQWTVAGALAAGAAKPPVKP